MAGRIEVGALSRAPLAYPADLYGLAFLYDYGAGRLLPVNSSIRS